MARAYSDDLRRKLLEAHAAGKGTLAELADRFGVSLGWAWKISSRHKRTKLMERQPYQAGPKTWVDREAIRKSLEAKPDLYLHELQTALEAATGQRVSKPHLWKISGELGFRRKKGRSTPPSGHGREAAAARGLCRADAHGRSGRAGFPG
jgi:transposase